MKNKILITIIFLIGILLICYPALKQPLWLDEIYSLYFAHSFSVKDLLFGLPETHPGGYYLLIKFILNFTTNTFLLRLISSVIPQLIGCFLIYKSTKNLYLTTLLLFNPFFIHQNWALRMYGITFLLSTILYIIYSKKHRHQFIVFSFFTIISTLFSFPLIIPISIFCLYQIIYKRQIKYLIPLIIIPLEFLALKGITTYKNYAELASWIYSPSFFNIPSNLTTLLGFNTDIDNLHKFSLVNSCIFYLISIPFVTKFSKKFSGFKLFFTIPIFITILVSIVFPIISQRFFFYQFIPKLSLFIPRFMLPLSVYFFIFLFKNISPLKSKLLLLIFLLLWINPYIKLNINSSYTSTKLLNQANDYLLLPPWENLRLPKNFQKNDLQKISQDYDLTQTIEKQLLQSPPDCTLYRQYPKIIYLKQSVKTLDNYQKQLEQSLINCSKAI